MWLCVMHFVSAQYCVADGALYFERQGDLRRRECDSETTDFLGGHPFEQANYSALQFVLARKACQLAADGGFLRVGAIAPATCCSRAPRPPRPRDTKRTSLSLLSRLCFLFGNLKIACIDLCQAHIDRSRHAAGS